MNKEKSKDRNTFSTVESKQGEGYINFSLGNETMLEFRENGDILVKGKLIENDKQIVDAMREFLSTQDCLSPIVDKKTNKMEEKSKNNDISFVDKFNKYQNEYDDFLVWCLHNNGKMISQEWTAKKAVEFKKRGLHNFFNPSTK